MTATGCATFLINCRSPLELESELAGEEDVDDVE